MPAIRIGNGTGFWGDNLDAPVDLARAGELDCLTLEYLAELSMAILSRLRDRDPSAGYVPDFVELMPRLVPMLRDQPGLKVISNGGGLNPLACAQATAKILSEQGLGDLVVATVSGDDLLADVPRLIKAGERLEHLETGRPIAEVLDKLTCFNAYIGGFPIAESLSQGARVVITGRVADASLTLGPVIHRFGLARDDWDRLAGASVAGHLIECGAQVTGGLWQDWREVPNLAAVGYPIAEVEAAGSCVITKPAGSGGMVTPLTVSAQLVYEIDDPSAYLTPDVIIDMTQVRTEEIGPNRVRVTGARGRPAPETLKVSAAYRDGWSASGLLAVTGRDAVNRARAAGEILLARVEHAGYKLSDTRIEVLGAGAAVSDILKPELSTDYGETVLRVTARDTRKPAIERFCREFAPLITSGPAGIAGYASGRPKPMPAFGFWPTLVRRALVPIRVKALPARRWVELEDTQ